VPNLLIEPAAGGAEGAAAADAQAQGADAWKCGSDNGGGFTSTLRLIEFIRQDIERHPSAAGGVGGDGCAAGGPAAAFSFCIGVVGQPYTHAAVSLLSSVSGLAPAPASASGSASSALSASASVRSPSKLGPGVAAGIGRTGSGAPGGITAASSAQLASASACCQGGLRFLRQCEAAGANFIVTAPVFDAQALFLWERDLRTLAGVTLPVIPSLLPMQSADCFLQALRYYGLGPLQTLSPRLKEDTFGAAQIAAASGSALANTHEYASSSAAEAVRDATNRYLGLLARDLLSPAPAYLQGLRSAGALHGVAAAEAATGVGKEEHTEDSGAEGGKRAEPVAPFPPSLTIPTHSATATAPPSALAVRPPGVLYPAQTTISLPLPASTVMGLLNGTAAAPATGATGPFAPAAASAPLSPCPFPVVHVITFNLEVATRDLLRDAGLCGPGAGARRKLPWRPSGEESRAGEDVRPIHWANRPVAYVERTASWQDFPSGRWGAGSGAAGGAGTFTSRSFGQLTTEHLIPHTAGTSEERRAIWGENPLVPLDVWEVFARYVEGPMPLSGGTSAAAGDRDAAAPAAVAPEDTYHRISLSAGSGDHGAGMFLDATSDRRSVGSGSGSTPVPAVSAVPMLVPRLPWCETNLHPETGTINKQLGAINRAGFLTINSQPSVNGVSSEDPTFGWGGPGGYVYQKAYVECFCSPLHLAALMNALAKGNNSISYHAVDAQGRTYTNCKTRGVQAVTWGVFPAKEIVQPTVVDPEAFLAWKTEAFALWTSQWAGAYEPDSLSYNLIHDIAESYFLVCLVDNDFIHGDIFGVFERAVAILGEARLLPQLQNSCAVATGTVTPASAIGNAIGEEDASVSRSASYFSPNAVASPFSASLPPKIPRKLPGSVVVGMSSAPISNGTRVLPTHLGLPPAIGIDAFHYSGSSPSLSNLVAARSGYVGAGSSSAQGSPVRPIALK
jgi:hypothetical protein